MKARTAVSVIAEFLHDDAPTQVREAIAALEALACADG